MLPRAVIVAILLTAGCATHRLGLIYDGMDAIDRVDPPPDLKVYKLYEGEDVRFAFAEMGEDGVIKGSCWRGAHGNESEYQCFGIVSGEHLYLLWSYGASGHRLGYPERAQENYDESDLYGIGILKLRVDGRLLRLEAFFDFKNNSDDLPTWQNGSNVIYNFSWPTLVAKVDHTVYGLGEETAAAAPGGDPPAGPPPTAATDEVMTKMKALKQMQDDGLITDEEYNQKKKELLDEM